MAPLQRPALPVLLLALGGALLAHGCGKDPAPPYKPPPQVTLALPDNNLADVRLPLLVTVTGCDTVQDVSLYDRDRYLKSVPYEGAPTQAALEANEVPYDRGIAANLSLIARATCDDGRTNDSNAAPARFLPVARSVEAPNLPQLFMAEGIGDNTTFVGCRFNTLGVTELVRVNQQGEVVDSNAALPFGCTPNGWITDRNNPSGKRWLVEDGTGAVAFDAQLNITAVIIDQVKYFTMGPEGDALYWNPSSGRLRRVSHVNGQQVWSVNATGILNGTPVVNPNFGIIVPFYYAEFVGYEGTLYIDIMRYSDGFIAAQNELQKIRYGVGDTPPSPLVTLSPDGTLAYIPVQTQPGLSAVLACATTAPFCSGANQKWQSAGLTGDVVMTLPFGQGGLVAAIAAQHTWFIDAATGQVVNKDATAIIPEGALVTVGVQPGVGREFYLLNSPNQAGVLPLEIVAVDAPEKGEVFRHALLGGSLTVALDDSGAPWLRMGERLVQPLPLSEYRKARP